MNETPSHTSIVEPPIICKARCKDDTVKISTPNSRTTMNTQSECRDDEGFQFSPVYLELDSLMNRDATDTEHECDTSFPQNDIHISTPEPPREESESERLARELSESESLARQLMAEEAMVSYQVSTEFLRDNADQFSQEDLAALQAAMAEEDPEVEDDEEYEDGEMSYDALLRLGERIGDVKEERWALVAKKMIESIPTVKFEKSMADGKDENHTEVKCLVCQFAYEEGEELRKLKCDHCFHKECIDEWLGSKDTCAFCRKSIVE